MKGARAKSDKLVHELWDKLKDVEGEGKANLAKTAQERRELTHAKQKLQQEVSVLRQAVTGKQKVANKNARAASVAPASRELQAAQTKMQQYRDRGEALRLELKCWAAAVRDLTEAMRSLHTDRDLEDRRKSV